MLEARAKTPETCLQDSFMVPDGAEDPEIQGDERKAMPVPHSSTAAAGKIRARTQLTAFPCKGCGA